jgi:hypothetical protein
VRDCRNDMTLRTARRNGPRFSTESESVALMTPHQNGIDLGTLNLDGHLQDVINGLVLRANGSDDVVPPWLGITDESSIISLPSPMRSSAKT